MRIPPPIQTSVFAGLMYGVHLVFEFSLYDSQSVVWPALFGIALGSWLIFPAVLSFVKNKTTVNPINLDKSTSLVVEGHYRFSRNPMYLGMAVILLTWGVYLSNPLNIAIFFIYLRVMTSFQILPEEKALLGIFGDEYAEYCRKVRRWV